MAAIAMTFAAVVLAFTITAVGVDRLITDVPVWAHVGTATFLLLASLCVRSLARLHVIDAVATVGGGVGFSLFTVGRPPTTARVLVLLLFLAHMLIIRAALVPSTARRTLWLSVLALLPSALQTGLVEARPGDTLGSPAALFTLTFVWAATTTLASSLVSKRIYGLERQVRQAHARARPATSCFLPTGTDLFHGSTSVVLSQEMRSDLRCGARGVTARVA